MGKIDTGNSTPVLLRRESARSPQTATHVKNMIVSGDFELIQETLCGDPASNMKFIHGPKVFDGHGVGRFS
jgi:hypothetical protein